MIRTSATMLESFRYYRKNDYAKESELIQTIKGEFKPNAYMIAGRAFHAILESPERFKTIGGYGRKDRETGMSLFFSDECMEVPLSRFDRRGLFELKGERVYTIDGRQITMVAKLDQALGLDDIETKTRWTGGFDFDKWQDAYQWRFQVEVFSPRCVKYRIFTLKGITDGAYDEEGFRFVAYDELTLYPYPSLHSDCVSLLSDFLAYCDGRNLTPYLEAAAERAAERERKAS